MMDALPTSNQQANSTLVELNDSVFSFPTNENKKNSNINIDLLEYKDFSNEDLVINVSEINGYFDKDDSLLTLTQNNVSKSLHQQIKPVKFTIATFTKFNFDFLRLNNFQNLEIKIYLNFKINDRYRKRFEFQIIKSELFIPPKLNVNENIAFFIPYESGQFLIEMHILSWNSSSKMPSSPFVVECLLEVVDLDLQVMRNNIFENDQSDCQVISIDCFQNDSLLSNVLFKMNKTVELNRPFFLKTNIENKCEWVTLFKQFERDSTSKVKFFHLSPWSCLMSFLKPSQFSIKLQIRSSSLSTLTNVLSLYACDSLTPSLSLLLASYELKVNCVPKYSLREPCVEATLASGGDKILLCKWTRIELTNREKRRHVKVDIRVVANGTPVPCGLARWRCTQSQLVMSPEERSAVLLYLEKPLLAIRSKHGPDEDGSVQVLLEQSGGQLPTVLTTRFPLHFDTCH